MDSHDMAEAKWNPASGTSDTWDRAPLAYLGKDIRATGYLWRRRRSPGVKNTIA